MDENKCNRCEKATEGVYSFPVKEEKDDFTSWIYRNRKALFVGACFIISYRFGYRAGKAEALSIIDHAIREAKGIIEG